MKVLRWSNLLTFILMIVVNILANTLPINNLTTGQVSDFYPVLFTPAGYVFSIWGLIYIALTGFVIYQILPGQAYNQRILKIGPWFILANLFNAGWIFAWHYQQISISICLMIGLLISLLTVFLRLEIGKSIVSPQEGLSLNFPFSLYLGWVSVATIANAAVFLYSINWDGWGLNPEVWMIFTLVIGSLLAIGMILKRNQITYPIVVVWAYIGIVFKDSIPEVVSQAASLGSLIILTILTYALLRARQHNLVFARKDRPKFKS